MKKRCGVHRRGLACSVARNDPSRYRRPTQRPIRAHSAPTCGIQRGAFDFGYFYWKESWFADLQRWRVATIGNHTRTYIIPFLFIPTFYDSFLYQHFTINLFGRLEMCSARGKGIGYINSDNAVLSSLRLISSQWHEAWRPTVFFIFEPLKPFRIVNNIIIPLLP